MSVRLGMDVGGTAVKLGLVTAEGAVTARAAVPFNPAQGFEEAAGAMCTAAARLLGDRKPEAVGIATPGYADPSTGILIDGSNNVPALRGYSLPAFVAQRFGAPAFIENDGTCATLGEMRFGAGRPFDRFVLITIGTGIGGGVVVDRRVVTGTGGIPAEIGALCLDPDGPTNYSGIPGTFERLASAAAFVEWYRGRSGRRDASSAEDVLRLAACRDAIAEAAVDGVARTIAQAFGVMTNLLNLEACIIGGGVSAAGEILLGAVRHHLARFTWPSLHRNVRVLLAHHGNDAGLIGAAVMAAQRLDAR
jgi:glucokinase